MVTTPRGAYWDEAIETMSPRETRRLEEERLVEQIAYDYATSAFYRSKLDAAAVRPDEIRSVDDLCRIPFMEKAEIAESQADGTLLGINQCAPLDRIVRIQATGGTTGQPMRIGLTRRDIEDYGQSGARALWAMGCRPGDIVFECMNYNLYAGGLSDHLTFETLGAATIPFGVGHSERLLAMMSDLTRPGRHLGDALVRGAPRRGRRGAWHRAPLGRPAQGVLLGRGRAAGARLSGADRGALGHVARDQYGTGELGLHSGECDERQGVHFGGTGIAIIELIDPDTGEVLPFDDGRQGEVVYTSIRREACPLLRMRSHDLMQVFTEPCRCGRTTFRFQILGRSDDMFIVKGVNVFPLSIQAVLLGFATPADRRVPHGARPAAADRLPGADHGRGRARGAGGGARRVRAEVADRLQAGPQLQRRPSHSVGPGTIATEKKTRRVIRTYRGETD